MFCVSNFVNTITILRGNNIVQIKENTVTTTKHKIGKVTYIVRSSASPKAIETLEKKIEKMIKKDAAQN